MKSPHQQGKTKQQITDSNTFAIISMVGIILTIIFLKITFMKLHFKNGDADAEIFFRRE